MLIKNHALAVLAGTLALGVSSCWGADESGTLSAGTSVNYSSGKYGAATSTDITSLPLTVAYDKGPWTLKLSVPYVRITGPGDVIVGIGKTSRTTTTIRTASGLGDIVTAATYNFYNDAASQFGADITGKVKFGTGDSAKGLGSGANDYSGLLDVYKRIGRVTLFGGIGYTIVGSTSTIPLRNVASLSAGSAYKLDDQSTVGLSYDYRQKTSLASAPLSEVTGFYSHKFNKTWKMQAYLLKGFSDGSPNVGGGVLVGYAF
jgi:hypothetical protein